MDTLQPDTKLAEAMREYIFAHDALRQHFAISIKALPPLLQRKVQVARDAADKLRAVGRHVIEEPMPRE